ncbi:Protein of unknown function DUF1068 [Dillenia turbinata]|uniref:Uncharacterized protein n=1 Tax=Dillenia turbinata TaxID=194707 RepID=A0AAN8UT86_9MAGN
MAFPQSYSRFCSPTVMRFVILLVGVSLIVYMVGSPLNLKREKFSSAQASCASCICDCSSGTIFSIPSEIIDGSVALADCGKESPEVNEEMEKDIIGLLSEELSLQRNVINDNMEHSKALIMDAKRASSQYQKEAEKCTVGVETCEEARETAEAALIVERKLSELWERRAREAGWSDYKG